jgi:hypothetical protein
VKGKRIVSVRCVTNDEHSTEIAQVIDSSDGPHFVARYRKFFLWAAAREGSPESSEAGAAHKWETVDQLVTGSGEYETSCTDHGTVRLPAAHLTPAIATYRSTGEVQKILVRIEPPRQQVWLIAGAPD